MDDNVDLAKDPAVPSTSGTQSEPALLSSKTLKLEPLDKELPFLHHHTGEDDDLPWQMLEGFTDHYEEELELDEDEDYNDEPETVTTVPVRRFRAPTTKLPVHLKGLMGEANLRYARGEIATAEKICFEIIRQKSDAFEPYLTLSQIYETEAPKKSIQYLTMAAHLNQSCPDHWIRLADVHSEGGNIRLAITCLTKAINADSSNVDLHLRRIHLLEISGDVKSLRNCRMRVLPLYTSDNFEVILNEAKDLTRMYHEEKNYPKALQAIAVPFKVCPDKVIPEMVNIYLQLLLLTGNHLACLDIFVQFCNVEIELIVEEGNRVNIQSCHIPNDIQIDLRMKLVICIIKLGAMPLVDCMIAPLLEDEQNAEKIGDLYFDVAEAFMSMGSYHQALQLLVPLVKSKEFSLAAIWLKYGDCLKSMDMIQQAIEAYQIVIRMAPQHTEVRHSMANLLLAQNNDKDALDVLTPPESYMDVDSSLLLRKMELLRQHKSKYGSDPYFQCVSRLLERYSLRFRHYDELHFATSQCRPIERRMRIKAHRQAVKMDADDFEAPPVKLTETLTVEEEFDLLMETLDQCMEEKRYAMLQRLVFTALCSHRFGPTHQHELLPVAFAASVYNDDTFHGYPIVRSFLMSNWSNNRVWNVFNVLILHRMDDMRFSRFLLRTARPSLVCKQRFLLATYAITMSVPKIAIVYLMPFLQAAPSPLVRLLLAVALLSVGRRDTCTAATEKALRMSFALINTYARTRGGQAAQEIHFNLARWHHQLGIMHVAASYYKRVLEEPNPFTPCGDNDDSSPSLDLRQEAAFNLMLLYQRSGDHIGARNLIVKYLVM